METIYRAIFAAAFSMNRRFSKDIPRFTEVPPHPYSIAMRRAVIDIGTNTVKLLVADVEDGKVLPVLSKDRTTRLGEGLVERSSGVRSLGSQQLTPTGETPAPPRLSRVAIGRTILAIDDFLNEARHLGAQDVLALTTSATRDATNRDEFLDGVRCKCGLEVRLISGDREAELIFRGVSSDPAWEGQPLLVMDVGGGSAEFIQGRAGRIELAQSLPLGALRLAEQFGEGKFTELCDYLRTTLRAALARYDVRERRMIGTGGTITTAAGILCAWVDHATISLHDLHSLVDRLHGLPVEERRKVPGLPPERADIIVPGGAAFLMTMEVLGVKELTVSVRNLRYGALAESVPQ
jgi:exopolyphosphatase / guanosine-5'-triphosphate,3'-diphosphate pyrophosphatase